MASIMTKKTPRKSEELDFGVLCLWSSKERKQRARSKRDEGRDTENFQSSSYTYRWGRKSKYSA